MNPIHLALFFTSAAVSLALMPPFIRLAHRFNLMDWPGHRKIHTKAVPKTGGMVVLAAILITGLAGLLFGGDSLSLTPERTVKISLVLGTILLAGLIGLFDDLYDLKPRTKLALQAVLFTAFALAGFHFQVLHLPGLKSISLSYFGYPLTVLWILAVVNGFNFIDGVDGLAGSVAVVSLAGMGVAASILNGPNFTGVLWVTALGAVLVFLVFNWKPARIYLGDTGSNVLGSLVALSLVSLGSARPDFLDFLGPASPAGAAEPFRFQFLSATLLAGYPLLEVTLSTLRRASKQLIYGRSMEWSEQEHIHHRLLKQGLRTGSICLLAMLFQGLLALGAVLAMLRQNALATWLLAPLFMFLAYLGPRTGILEFLRMRNGSIRHHYQIAHHFISMQRVKMRLIRHREEVLALVSQTCRELGVRCYRVKIKPDGRGKGGLDFQFRNDDTLLTKTEGFLLTSSAEFSEEFYDFCETPGRRGEAFWIFDSHLAHDELDMEYRVLMNGFMREALDNCERMGVGCESLEVPSVASLPHQQTSSHHLRKRHSMSVN